MESILTIGCTLFLGLFIWRIQVEYDISISFFAYTKTIFKQLESILNPYGVSDNHKFAQMRYESFEKEVIPYIAEWRIVSEKFQPINKELYTCYLKCLEEALLTFKTKIMILVSEASSDENKREAKDFLLGLNEDFTSKTANTLTRLEKDFYYIIKHPYKSYLKRICNKI